MDHQTSGEFEVSAGSKGGMLTKHHIRVLAFGIDEHHGFENSKGIR